ncbi:permease-like cell division protein FtsX [uncultured Ruminococcus sp.]|uniref:permease-like cell division protein FtsX n=1 Tax=uncultured Ruminococcus sp. TaxID=165186 RepID=UPI0025DBFF48|nr:permease-like cell division protein FtsX [uncultured Ruminococcus sp.]
MKLSGLKYLTGQGVENIWKNRMMAFASFCVLLVSLLLVGMSILFYMNLNSMIGGVEDKNEVIVYMDEGTTDQQLAEFQTELEQIDNISKISFYSKEQAFEDLKSSMKDYELLFDSLGDDNPLIDGYRIQIQDISQINTTISQIEQLDHIYSIRAPMDFVNILTEVRKIVSVIFGVIIAALIVISVVIVSNATKASVFARREEIQIMKYVGATNAFIRIPFFVEGMITGFLAGCVALAITWFGYDSLVGLLTGQVDFLSVIGMGSIISFRAVAWKVALAYLVSGTLFGACGSMLSMRKHLNV